MCRRWLEFSGVEKRAAGREPGGGKNKLSK
jgi:hypothetical protein